MERAFKADLDSPGLREKLYVQMNESLVIQVKDILKKFGPEADPSKASIDARTQEGKIDVNIPGISDELREQIQKELNGLGQRENYKITLG